MYIILQFSPFFWEFLTITCTCSPITHAVNVPCARNPEKTYDFWQSIEEFFPCAIKCSISELKPLTSVVRGRRLDNWANRSPLCSHCTFRWILKQLRVYYVSTRWRSLFTVKVAPYCFSKSGENANFNIKFQPYGYFGK